MGVRKSNGPSNQLGKIITGVNQSKDRLKYCKKKTLVKLLAQQTATIKKHNQYINRITTMITLHKVEILPVMIQT